MSNHVAKCCHDEEVTSETPTLTHQLTWMSHWMKKGPNPPPMVNNSPMICYENNSLTEGGLKIEDDSPKSREGLGKKIEEIETGIMDENLPTRAEVFQNKISYSLFPALELCQQTEPNSSTKPQIDHEFGDKAISLALSLGKNDAENFNTLQKSQLRNSENRVMPHSYPGQNGITESRFSAYKEVGSTSYVPPHQSDHSDASGPVVVFERHFSNDNFSCLDQGDCKYKKFSTFLFHEKKMNNELNHELRQSDGLQMQCDPSTNKNFLPFFLKKQSENIQGHSSTRIFPTHRDNDQGKFGHGCRASRSDGVPCSDRNVETTRICTMVDSVENSPRGSPKISQRAHHLLFTKGTCVNMSDDAHQDVQEPIFSTRDEGKTFGVPRPQGVKIQPLWTSTDSEGKENTFNPSTCEVELRNESSAETEAMQIEVRENQHIMLGTESCSLIKYDAMDVFDSRAKKPGSKRPMTEIPDMNEELPGLQPAVSSTDGTEPSASRVQSSDATNRWIKRLKRSPDSFDVGEGSSNEKFNLFFNKMMKCNKESQEDIRNKCHGKEQMVLDQDRKALTNIGSSSSDLKRKNQDMVLGSPWIKRWCQNSSTLLRNPEPLVMCEPHNLMLEHDELSKKQFPSIAAMALMGKAMNGFPPCEFRKRGNIVVWKTE